MSRVGWSGLICTSTGLLVTFYNYWIQKGIMELNERHLCVTSHPSGLLCYLSERCHRFGPNMNCTVLAINSYNWVTVTVNVNQISLATFFVHILHQILYIPKELIKGGNKVCWNPFLVRLTLQWIVTIQLIFCINSSVCYYHTYQFVLIVYILIFEHCDIEMAVIIQNPSMFG